MMKRWIGRVAIVTGASAGCGAKLSEVLVRHGMKVVGCARNVDKVEALSQQLLEDNAHGELKAIRCDVTREEDVSAMFDEVVKLFGHVDVCINNAGLAHDAPLLSGSTEQWRNMLNTNVLGVAVCTREAVKAMNNCGVTDGHIINVNSGNGHVVSKSPQTTFYSATKFAVTAMTEGVRTELRQAKSDIRVTQISPWMIATEFRQRMSDMTDEECQKYYGSRNCLTTDDVADAVVYALSAPPSVQVHDIHFAHTMA